MLLKEFLMCFFISYPMMNVLKETIEKAVMLLHISYPMRLCSPPGSGHRYTLCRLIVHPGGGET